MSKKSIRSLAATLLASAAMTAPALADSHNTEFDAFTKALVGGTPYANVRYRFEHVDQAGFTKDANASTIRTRLGYRTGVFNGFSGVLEMEDVTPIGSDGYNSTTNGKTQLPTVADPDGTEVNQAFITFTGISDTKLKYGRHNLKRNNVRFIGDVGWRQNNQVHDGGTITNTSIPDTELFYGFSHNINRIFGDSHPAGDFNGAVHMVDATYKGLPWGKLVGYGYFFDFDNSAANSSKTYGANFKGKAEIHNGVNFLYDLEYARQTDHGNNTTNYSANYYRVEPGISYSGVTLKAGHEVLGSDNAGTVAFATPLATLHKWNGWADRFLTTPATGLKDSYASAAYKVNGTDTLFDGTKLMAVYHDFSADSGSADYGTEWNFNTSRNFMKHYSIGIKYANYDADTFSVDTEKVILSLGFKFN